MAAIAMVALVGGIAMVVDVGSFLVIQSQFQSAADAGALAGAWYDPICVLPDPANLCVGSISPPGPAPTSAATAAIAMARANAEPMTGLCGGAVKVTVPSQGTRLNVPANVNTIVVTVECDAGFTFGRIIPGVTTKHISASAAAAIGDRKIDPTLPIDCTTGGDITSFTAAPPCGRIARLLE